MTKPSLSASLRRLSLLVALHAPLAHAGDFLDFRLSFNLVDENVFSKPGDVVPSIPGLRFGAPLQRWGVFFYDQWDTRLTGFENLTNMVVYKDLNFGQEEFEGAFVLRFNSYSDNLSAIYDGGSYIKWTHWFDPTREGKTNVSLTAFPFSSDLFRLGYSYKVSWGGSQLMFKPNPDNPLGLQSTLNTNAVPGLRLQFAGESAYAFVGAKTSVMLNVADNQQEPIYGVLAGAGYDVSSMIRVEANGGYFYRGTNPNQSVLGAPVVTYGLSAQVVLHQGTPVGRSGDFPLYRNDPSGAFRYLPIEEYPGGLSWLVSAEATVTQTTLEDLDRTASTTRQTGFAADLNARIKWNHWRIRGDFLYQNLAQLLVNVPSFVPFQALSPTSATVTPQIFVAAGADYFFESLRFTLGGSFGIQLPATYQGKLPDSLVNGLPADAQPVSATAIIRSDNGLFDLLPPGYNAVPVYAARLNGTLAFSYFNVLGDLLLAYDNNLTHLQRINNDPQQIPTRVFINPWQLGFNIALQFRI
jgi:hypothetical protein